MKVEANLHASALLTKPTHALAGWGSLSAPAHDTMWAHDAEWVAAFRVLALSLAHLTSRRRPRITRDCPPVKYANTSI